MPLACPLLASRPHAHQALPASVRALLADEAARITAHPVEASVDVDEGVIQLHAFVPIGPDLLAEARRLFPEADVRNGDELGVDLFQPGEAGAGLLGLTEAGWRDFYVSVCRRVRALLEAEHALSDELQAAWVNLDYARSTNARHPDLNPASPGEPYFAGTASRGQWIRIVFQLAGSTQRVWGVGIVNGGDEREVRFEGLRYENGAEAPPACFAVEPFDGVARLSFDGIWDVITLRPARSSPAERSTGF